MANKQDFRLADYLQPRGSKPYKTLPDDLTAALDAGNTVYLWSVPGFFMLAGHPDLTASGRPWSDGQQWYKTAKDALDKRRGRV